MRLLRLYCEREGPDGLEHVTSERPPRFRNNFPRNPIEVIRELTGIGAPDEHGGLRLRGPVLRNEPADFWDVICAVCGSCVRGSEVV